MKEHKHFPVILAFTLLIFGGTFSNAATLSVDLDLHTPGIQNNLTLNPGSGYEVGVVFSGDGSTQFDTFALDLVHGSSVIDVHNPIGRPFVGSAQLMAMDIYGAVPVTVAIPYSIAFGHLNKDDTIDQVGNNTGSVFFVLLGE